MKAELISIGDELLIGQTINTNSAWLGMELSLRGIPVQKCTVISDTETAILSAISEGFEKSDLIIMTGGLGPTKDDITKHTLCKYFNTTLEINSTVLERVEGFFKSRGREMLEVNVQQAALPVNCIVLHNLHGTASGMWFEHKGSVLISLPGVPYEMKGIMMDEVFPRLIDLFDVSKIFHKTILLQGIGESFLAEEMKDWEDRIKAKGFGLAYLPSIGLLKLRITSPNGVEDDSNIESFFEELTARLPQHVFGREEQSLSDVLGDILRGQQKTIGTVESCTGGSLAHSLVSVSGSSDYFQGSILTYSNELKMKLVDVNESDLNQFGAVSEEVVLQMAKNGRKKLGVDVCISTSGVAGPNGGSEDKPVGTVWVGISLEDRAFAFKFRFGDNRDRNIQMSVLSALNLTRCSLLKISIKK
jgi:nicotinamide-nucleotide amidase